MDGSSEYLPAPNGRTVPANGPRPTMQKLAKMILTLLSPYFQADADMLEAQVEAFKVALDDLPEEALSAAIVARLKSSDRRKPIPGEIRAAAQKFIRYSHPQVVVDNSAPVEDKEFVTAARARELIEEVGESKIGEAMLRAIEAAEAGRISFADTIQAVSEASEISVAQIKGNGRSADVVLARFAVEFLAYDLCRMSTTQIAKQLGGRDHTTVCHGLRRARELMCESREFRQIVTLARKALV